MGGKFGSGSSGRPVQVARKKRAKDARRAHRPWVNQYDGGAGGAPIVPREKALELEVVYLSDDSGRCPVCRSDDIEAEPVEAVGGQAFGEVSCHKCGSTWEERYTLTGVTIKAVRGERVA